MDFELELLSEDILHRERRILRYEDLHLSDLQLQEYALCDIERLLNKNARSLREFETMPYPNTLLLSQSNNRLLQEELDYDRILLADEHMKLLSDLNYEQRKIYDAVIGSVTENKGGVYFVYGHGGTGKTYLWRTLICRLRSEGKIVIAVAIWDCSIVVTWWKNCSFEVSNTDKCNRYLNLRV
jgi:Cdc6-like AAA superfamily ATPase